jgi:hypothetical protein
VCLLRSRPISKIWRSKREVATLSEAVGAIAIGALAIGRLAIDRVVIKRARFGKLEVDELTVRRLHVVQNSGSTW